MLNKDTENRLKVLGFDVSKLTEAIKAEDEISLDVPTLYTDEQKNTFGSNRFNDGKTAMSEILAKDVKSQFNIDIDSKDINEVVKAYGESKVNELNKKPDERIQALENEKTELQNKLSNLSSEKQTIESEFSKKLFHVEVKTQLNSLIPDNTKIDKSDISQLFFNTHEIAKDDNGRTIVKKSGEVIKDDLLNPLELKDVVNSFIDKKGYIEKSGMGGDDRMSGGSAKFKNMAEFMTYCDKNGVEPMGSEGQAMLSANKAESFSY